MKISCLNTKTVPTVKVELNNQTLVFHSKYDPLHASQKWAENTLILIKPEEEVIVFGLCAGYHIVALSKLLPNTSIIVVEFNDQYYDWFATSLFKGALEKCKNVSLKKFSELSEYQRNSLFTSISSTNICSLEQYFNIIPVHFSSVVAILRKIILQNKSLSTQIGFMKENFNRNVTLNDDGIHNMKEKYLGKPMILISAGPSLNKQLPLLKTIQNSGNFILGAVGTSLSPLISYGITPDFYAIIDAQATEKQLDQIDLPNTTLFYLSTASTNTILLHKGPRRVIWQRGYEEAELMAKQFNDPTMETGGSVATILLDIMVYLGGGPIALVGQDLAFTGGKTHASGTHSSLDVIEQFGKNQVLNYYRNGTVMTSNNLTLYRMWFEDYAENHGEHNLMNCTEGGAYIQNWEHISLLEYYKKFK
ncbi:motility associated factor glycosyltransferase family protein [Sporosarcina sp. SAFN-010]|uniref:motility associated factor glycosyltransferase family protein n=1 Tax=Sporosarcina sp. SAFN-010 TaxID=3387273 RepID=UPI003F7D25CB